jgi:hypothetical protein
MDIFVSLNIKGINMLLQCKRKSLEFLVQRDFANFMKISIQKRDIHNVKL